MDTSAKTNTTATTADAAEEVVQLVSLYQKSKKIYPRSVKGRFVNWRWHCHDDDIGFA